MLGQESFHGRYSQRHACHIKLFLKKKKKIKTTPINIYEISYRHLNGK
jgi:hypothetical protein